MVSRKYAKDYSVEYRATRSGGLRGVAVYVGPYFRYAASDARLRRAKLVLPLLTLLCWAAFAVSMSVNARLPRRIFVLMPHAACLLPLALLTVGVVMFLTVKPPLIREHSDSIRGRISTCSLIMLIFSGVALLGAAVSAFAAPSGTYSGADWLYLALLFVFVCASAAVFCFRGYANTVPDGEKL